jgi:chorismate synthase
MAGNSFGTVYRLTTFGESHGPSVGVVVDGCPPGVDLRLEHIQLWTDRRRPGQPHQAGVASPRKEKDVPEILSGVHENFTLGTPIAMAVRNEDTRSVHYAHLRGQFRPGHADYTIFKKYQFMDWAGGGRASARETVGRVMAGAVAFRVLKRLCPELITSCHVQQVANIVFNAEPAIYDHNKIYSADNPMRCPDPLIGDEMRSAIEAAGRKNDSVGSAVAFVIKNVPVGLGEPVFDKLLADIAKAILSLPAVKAIEFGSGFGCIQMLGSKHNDEFVMKEGEVHTKTNNAGGSLGGISSGELIYGRIAFKPPSSIGQKQHSVDINGANVELDVHGRHDPCLGPRAVPIVECSLANVLLDHVLRNFLVQSVRGDFSRLNLTRFLEEQNPKE